MQEEILISNVKQKKLIKAHQNNLEISKKNLSNKFEKFEENVLKESETLLYETTVKPSNFKRYARGRIVKVKFGVNIGSEFSGDHFAIVVSKGDTMKNPVLHVIPITSKAHIKNVEIGPILYNENKLTNSLKEFYNTQVYNKVSKTKEELYKNLIEELDNTNENEKKISILKLILQITKDFTVKDDIIKQLKDLENKYNLKKVYKDLKENCEFLSMLHERINTYKIKDELSQIDDYSKKKKFVDNLYKDKDSQNKVKQSYMANYNITDDKFYWNVSFLDGKQYEGMVDLFVGGSPCQSFSLVGKQRGLEDTRGTLFYEYARLISEIKPKVFIYENVKAVLSNDSGKTWKTMQKVFTDLNYNWKPAILNAKDFGIPQNRERLYVVGFRNDLKLMKEFSFPDPIKLDKTLQDFLLDNVSGRYYLPKKGVDFVTSEKNLDKKYTQIDGKIALCQKRNQQFNWHGDFVFEEENKDKEKTMKELDKYFLSEKVKKYVLSTGTKGFYSKPEIDLKVARPLLNTMHKMHRAGVDNYVTTEGRLRKLTPRECLRLMGFSDSFKIVVSDTAMYQQAGNSIVVNVLMAIMEKILESYDLGGCDNIGE